MRRMVGALWALWLLATVLPGWAQPIDVLVVDETETLVESLAVNLIVGLLQQEPTLFGQIDTVFATVASAYDLPLRENPSGHCYQLVIVAPKNVLQLHKIWIATAPFPQNYAAVQAALTFLRALGAELSQRFNVEIKLVDVNEDGFVGILASFFQRLGLLKAPASGTGAPPAGVAP